VILENVEEFRIGAAGRDGRGLMPDPERKGETFQKWCKKLRARRQARIARIARLRLWRADDPQAAVRHHPIRRQEDRLAEADAWRARRSRRHRRPQAAMAHGVADIIDWSLPCPSIFDTSEAIMRRAACRAAAGRQHVARVARGMKRYVLDAERPFLVNLTHGGRCEPLDEPMNTITGAHRGEKAAVTPYLVPRYGERPGQVPRARAVDVPAPVVVPTGNGGSLVSPHLMTMRNAGKPFNGADQPTHTITAGGAGLSLVAPHLSAFYGPGDGGQDRAADIDEPVRTVTTENRHAVIAPVLSYAQQGGNNRPASKPLHTICASEKDQNQVACAFIAQHNNDSRRIRGVNPGREAEEPLSTVTATGAQQGVVSAFISRQFGTSTGHAAGAPLGTITADGQGKSALIAPHLHAYYGVDQDTPETEPFHTLTTKPRFSHVEASVDAPPFTAEQEGRAREVAAFMRVHGFWDEREFVTLDIGGITYVIVDIGMRMLTPRELYNAQGFPPDYEIERGGDGAVFSKSVQVSCVGNSVSPPVACALVAANCADLVEMREAAE
jgi:DNA (cytosine-5)-methyltransferase 1